jgi:hypothetical protein
LVQHQVLAALQTHRLTARVHLVGQQLQEQLVVAAHRQTQEQTRKDLDQQVAMVDLEVLLQ